MGLPGWVRGASWNPLNRRKRQRRTAKRRKRERRQHRETPGWTRPDDYAGSQDDERIIKYYFPEGDRKRARKPDLRSGKERRVRERRRGDRRHG